MFVASGDGENCLVLDELAFVGKPHFALLAHCCQRVFSISGAVGTG
jgi:hypothetical protein